MRQPRRKRATHEVIVDHLTALTTPEIRTFFRRHKLPDAGVTKEALRTQIKAAINGGQITVADIVTFLDEVTPWGKQHIYLYEGPSSHSWRNTAWATNHFKSHKLQSLLNAKSNRLVLPEHLELASISWTTKQLRIAAIRRREGWVRREEYDRVAKADGRPMELRAFVHQVFRGITAFEWNLVSNEAFLQITQLPTGASYENVAAEFERAIQLWLDLSAFKRVDLRKLITRMDELVEKGKTDVEVHALAYGRVGQRRITARSTSTKVPLHGDLRLDRAMKSLRSSNIPRIGDYFWPCEDSSNGKAPKRIHVIVVAEHQRINFATPNTQDGFRNVLQGLRKLSP